MTRFLVALLGGAFIFVTVWYLCGLVLLWLAPPDWAYTEVRYQSISASLSSVIAVGSGALAAVVVFLALLLAKASGTSQSAPSGRARVQRHQPEIEQETNLVRRMS